MRKRLVVLGFALSQSVAMFATIEDAQSVSDSVAVQTSPVLVVEDSVKRSSEVPLDTADYFDEQNDIIEMEAAKPLPEYRWTTIGVTFGGGLAWYNSTPIFLRKVRVPSELRKRYDTPTDSCQAA